MSESGSRLQLSSHCNSRCEFSEYLKARDGHFRLRARNDRGPLVHLRGKLECKAEWVPVRQTCAAEGLGLRVQGSGHSGRG